MSLVAGWSASELQPPERQSNCSLRDAGHAVRTHAPRDFRKRQRLQVRARSDVSEWEYDVPAEDGPAEGLLADEHGHLLDGAGCSSRILTLQTRGRGTCLGRGAR